MSDAQILFLIVTAIGLTILFLAADPTID